MGLCREGVWVLIMPRNDVMTPSDAYALDAVMGVPGAWQQVIVGMAKRSILITSALYVSGVRGQQLFMGTVLTTSFIEIFVINWALQEKKKLLSERE